MQIQTIAANELLAERIISARANDPYVRELCSGDFLIDPIAHLINKMIARGTRRSSDDESRAFVMGLIPGFMEKATSPKYLRRFAAVYFKDEPNRIELMRVFEKALSDTAFEVDSSEESLRSAYAIFTCQNSLKV